MTPSILCCFAYAALFTDITLLAVVDNLICSVNFKSTYNHLLFLHSDFRCVPVFCQCFLTLVVDTIPGTGEVGQVYMDQNGQYFIRQAPEEQQLTASGRPKVTSCL